MTMKVRIEKADTTGYKLAVEVWEKGSVLGDGSVTPDRLVETANLNNPAEMTEMTIWKERYLVVKEAGEAIKVPDRPGYDSSESKG